MTIVICNHSFSFQVKNFSIRIRTNSGLLIASISTYKLVSFRISRLANDFSKTSHEYGFSPACTSLCVLRWWIIVNDLIQALHVYPHSPVWGRQCLFRLSFADDFLQSLHEYFPIYNQLLISLKKKKILKDFLQTSNEYESSPVCNSSCTFRWEIFMTAFSQTMCE
jgi:hypothetical protein